MVFHHVSFGATLDKGRGAIPFANLYSSPYDMGVVFQLCSQTIYKKWQEESKLSKGILDGKVWLYVAKNQKSLWHSLVYITLMISSALFYFDH